MLRIYSTDIYFFVMANLFYSSNKLSIDEKYDIKGSTVNRSSAPPSEGQSCTCRHCGQKFFYHKKKYNYRLITSLPSQGSDTKSAIPSPRKETLVDPKTKYFVMLFI
jgi:hypothetical protein